MSASAIINYSTYTHISEAYGTGQIIIRHRIAKRPIWQVGSAELIIRWFSCRWTARWTSLTIISPGLRSLGLAFSYCMLNACWNVGKKIANLQ